MTTRYLYSIVNGRSTLSPICRKTLEEHGKKAIVKMEVARKPINPLVKITLDVFKKTGYDKLYHLCLICYLENGVCVVWEKNAVVHIERIAWDKKGFEIMPVEKMPQEKITLNDMVRKTSMRMAKKFLPYSSFRNNCQVFVQSTLSAIDCLTPELADFIRQQKTDDVFAENTGLRKFANTITDLGGRADVVFFGDGLRVKKASYTDA